MRCLAARYAGLGDTTEVQAMVEGSSVWSKLPLGGAAGKQVSSAWS
mgnify:CR=1 FL=1